MFVKILGMYCQISLQKNEPYKGLIILYIKHTDYICVVILKEQKKTTFKDYS